MIEIGERNGAYLFFTNAIMAGLGIIFFFAWAIMDKSWMGWTGIVLFVIAIIIGMCCKMIDESMRRQNILDSLQKGVKSGSNQ